LKRAFIVCLLLSTALISAYAFQGPPPPAPGHHGGKPLHHLTTTKDSLTPRDTTHFGDVTIELKHDSDSIRLDSDFVCDGNFHLKKGVLNLNHHKLKIHGNCLADSGTIKCDSLSSIEVIGNDSTIKLRFGHGRQHLGKLKIHDCDTTVIEGDLVVTDSVELVGGVLDISTAAFDPQGPFTMLNTFLAGNGKSTFNYHGNTKPDTLRFVSGKDSLGILKIDHSKFPLVFGTNVRICDSLCLDSAKILINKGILTLDKKCVLKGFNRTNYVITGDSGSLQRTVPGNGKELEFPIGTVKHYAPAFITQVKGADTSEYKVNVVYGVLTNGLTGDSLNLRPLIKNTWHVTCSADSFRITLKLKAPKELATLGFNPKKCFISHYEKHRWDSIPPTVADTLTDATAITLTRTGIQTLSPFTIMSASAPTSLSSLQENKVMVYPNPATDFVTFSAATTGSKLTLMDITGRIQRNLTLSSDNSTVNVSDLPAGLYLYKIVSNGKITTTGKLAVKK